MTSAIYFDPALPPFDLGAVLFHEVDHFLRDKIVFADEWDRAGGTGSLTDWYTLDEVMANFAGATAEFRIFSSLSEQTGTPRRFVQDFRLFSRHGQIASVWKDRVTKGEPWAPFDELTGLFALPESGDRVAAIANLVSRSYFGDWPTPDPEVIGKFQSMLGREAKTFFSPLLRALGRGITRDEPWQFSTDPSPGCRAFAEGIRSGQLPVPFGADETLRPGGGEGARPGGGEGARPGGGEGARPSGTIRACLAPEEKL
jgi:hypothetical protein